jgi:hypothetical protein
LSIRCNTNGRDRSGGKIFLEEWIDIWVGMLEDIEPTTRAKYKYFVEAHILPQFQGREIGSLTFEEIEKWEKAIPTRTSARVRPYARSVATGARSLLITILGDAVHARRLDRNPAERRKGRRGKVRAKGRAPAVAQERTAANVITPAGPSRCFSVQGNSRSRADRLSMTRRRLRER